MSLTQSVVVFAGSGAVVSVAGVHLARAGDELAERTGMSRLVVGMLLVATATSLPEIVTDVSAALEGAPDLAVGDLFGSSMANMAVLAVIDLISRQRVWALVEVGHARVASVAVALTALATLSTLTTPSASIAWVGMDTLAIAAGYLAAVAWMRRSPVGRFGLATSDETDGILPTPIGWSIARAAGTGRPLARLGVAALAILVSAPFLAGSGIDIAVETGMGQTFVGSALVALATSLPELVASLAATRIGAFDLAVGNLFGSNAFNMFVLVFADVAYTDGPLLGAIDPGQAVAGVGAILLMALALMVIVHGTETHIRRLEPDAVLLLATYGGALYAVWTVRP